MPTNTLNLCQSVSRHVAFRTYAVLLVGVSAASASSQVASPIASSPAKPIPRAAVDDALEISGEEVSAKELQTRMAVAVLVNGQGPFRFVVDSGADRSVVSSKIARSLTLPPSGRVTLHGMAGTSLVETVFVESLGVAGGLVRSIHAPTLAEPDLGADGLVGIDALAEQRLMLDFDRNEVVVQGAHRSIPSLPGEIVVTARREHGQLILTEARALGSQVDAVIDTGSQITVGNLALRARLLRARKRLVLTPVTLISVTGATAVGDLAMIPELEIGGIRLENVTMAFADLPPFAVFGLSEHPAILLGTDVMRSFKRISLDFRRRKVRFQLRQSGRGPAIRFR